MEIDDVIITNINRESLTLRADNEVKQVVAGHEMEFEFIYLIGNQTFESKTKLRINEDKTISELEDLIKDIMNRK